MKTKLRTIILVIALIAISFWAGVGITYNRMMARFGKDVEQIKADNAYLYRELYKIENYKIERVRQLTRSINSYYGEVDRLGEGD